uniref:Uncharacterized protein n=1 Tax=Myotis myotis TaxID=51298 RepID=A0A7J7TIN7_MYOMY|nr:hypothetical protein mMyoMyo1_009042 [Myotis myotis]
MEAGDHVTQVGFRGKPRPSCHCLLLSEEQTQGDQSQLPFLWNPPGFRHQMLGSPKEERTKPKGVKHYEFIRSSGNADGLSLLPLGIGAPGSRAFTFRLELTSSASDPLAFRFDLEFYHPLSQASSLQMADCGTSVSKTV